MSNKNLNIIILVALVLLTGVFAWMYHLNKARFDWTEQNSMQAYQLQSSEPYGLKVMHNILEAYTADSVQNLTKSYSAELPIDSTETSCFFFAGEAVGVDSIELTHLMTYVAAGNTAFISSKSLPGMLSMQLYHGECDDSFWGDYERDYVGMDSFSLVLFKDTDRAFPFFYSYRNQPQPYSTHYIPADIFYCENENNYASLGYVEDDFRVNFAEFGYGKGRFLLHSTPIAFTNFHLLREEGQSYCASILAFLPKTKIYWDGFSNITEQEGRRRNRNQGYSKKTLSDNPLSTLLSNKSLAWAWYLSLALGTLFVFFKGKRRQRTIPILPKNTNTSMEFIETIAQLHFKEKNYKGIAIQKMRLFLAHIRERYAIHLHPDSNNQAVRTRPQQIQQLIKQSEAPEALVRSIFEKYAAIIQYEPTDEMLVDFYQAVEQFQLYTK